MFEYNPNNIIVTFGPNPLSGFNADDIVTVEFDEKAVTKTVGAQGEVVFTVNPNKGGKASVSLLQGAEMNTILSGLCAQTLPARSRLIVLPFIVTDLGGLSLAVGPKAVIESIPPVTFKKGHEVRTWEFLVAKWTVLVNGGAL